MINTRLTSRVFVRNDYVLIGPTIPKLAVSFVPPMPTSAPFAKLEIPIARATAIVGTGDMIIHENRIGD